MAAVVDAGPGAGSNLVSGEAGNSLTFTLPSSPRYAVQSVVATVDNTAGATTTATLTMADSNGAVIADRPQAASVAAADTGRVTWALGLTDTGQVSSASAWVLLDTVTLTASGTIAFDSITQATYQHLRLVGQVRGVNGNQLGLQFNGSGGTAYNSTWVTAEGDAFGQSVLNGAG